MLQQIEKLKTMKNVQNNVIHEALPYLMYFFLQKDLWTAENTRWKHGSRLKFSF